jgi:hypothetical protein
MLGECPLQDGDDPPGAERGPDFDRQALPCEFIDQREDSKRLAVGAMIFELGHRSRRDWRARPGPAPGPGRRHAAGGDDTAGAGTIPAPATGGGPA